MLKQNVLLLTVSFMLVTAVNAQDVAPASPIKYGNVKTTGSDKAKVAAVLKREGEKRDAYMKLDPKMVAELLADDYIAPSPGHPGCCFHDRALGILSVEQHRDFKDPMPIQSYRAESTNVRIYGRIAVVTGIEIIDMTLTKHVPPVPVTARFLYTDIWELKGSKWMLIGAQHDKL
jgi:hypothetical protein